MDVLSKILMIFFSLAMMPDLYINDKYVCLIIGMILVISLIKNLSDKWKDFFNGRYEHRFFTFGEFNDEFYNDYNFSYPNVSVNHRKRGQSTNIYIPSFNDDSDIAKDVEGKCKIHQTKAEFLNEDNMIIPFNKTTTIVKANKKKDEPRVEVNKDEVAKTKITVSNVKKDEVIEVDNNNGNRPNIFKELEKDTYTTASNTKDFTNTNSSNSNSNAFIFINESELDKNVKGVYCSVINVLTEKKYPTSKICRILKSIQYVDLCEDAIVFYIENNELESTDILPKDEIINKLRSSFRGSENIEIVFERIKTVSIFDFYMSNKK